MAIARARYALAKPGLETNTIHRYIYARASLGSRSHGPRVELLNSRSRGRFPDSWLV